MKERYISMTIVVFLYALIKLLTLRKVINYTHRANLGEILISLLCLVWEWMKFSLLVLTDMAGFLFLWGVLLLTPGSCTSATTSTTTPTTSSIRGTPSQGSPTPSSSGISSTSSSTSEISSVTTTSHTTSDTSAITRSSSTTSDISAATTPSSTARTTQLSTTFDDQSTRVCIRESSAGDGAGISAAEVAGSVVAAVVVSAFVSSTITYYIIRRKYRGKPVDERMAETTGGSTTNTLPEETDGPVTAKPHCPDTHVPVYIGVDIAVEKGPLHAYDSETRKTELDDISVIDLDHSERLVFAYNPLTMAGENMDDPPQSEL
ncbi:cell wall protein DAN4-like isoform X1 [Haliotis rubra]|uniref:cell wall protein DAN4-like isoform X1 n=1 Tax=Haliotis rubra TaxID=36100 RepID=UPI001EE612AC|nr:cell wall protein DAN4-like isoform X1 [Haliotis rubra]